MQDLDPRARGEILGGALITVILLVIEILTGLAESGVALEFTAAGLLRVLKATGKMVVDALKEHAANLSENMVKIRRLGRGAMHGLPHAVEGVTELLHGRSLPPEWGEAIGKLHSQVTGEIGSRFVGTVKRDAETFHNLTAGVHMHLKGGRSVEEEPAGFGGGGRSDAFRPRERDAIYDEESNTHNYDPSLVAQHQENHDRIKMAINEIEHALPAKSSTLVDDISFDPSYISKNPLDEQNSSFSAGRRPSDPRVLKMVVRDVTESDAYLKLTLLHEFEHAYDFDNLVKSFESAQLHSSRPIDRAAAVAQARAEFHPEPTSDREIVLRRKIQYSQDEISVETRAFERLEKYFGKSVADEVRAKSSRYIEKHQSQVEVFTKRLEEHLRDNEW